MAEKRDWPAVREEYVQGNLTVRELAAKVDLPEAAVEKHCTKEKWVEARREYREHIAREVEELGAKREARKRVNLLDSSYEIIITLKDTIDKISARMQEKDFTEKVKGTEAGKLLERLSSLSTSFEKMARAINLLEGGPDSRVQLTLADILGSSDSAALNSNE